MSLKQWEVYSVVGLFFKLILGIIYLKKRRELLHLIIISILSTTFATSIYFVAIKKIGTSQASAFIFLVPFFVITLSSIFLDETVYITTILGTILTISAVYILNKKEK